MGLELLLEPAAGTIPGKPCKVARTLTGLAEPYRSALENLLATPYRLGGLTDEALALKLRQAGIPVGATLLNRHRRGLCTCERQAVD
jgi:hypothetical protein